MDAIIPAKSPAATVALKIEIFINNISVWVGISFLEIVRTRGKSLLESWEWRLFFPTDSQP